MANSHRKQILDYLRDTVFALITTGGGYNFTVGTRKRGMLPIESLPESSFPVVLVGRASEERQNITVNQFQARMQVVIIGYVKSDTGLDGLMGEVDDLIEDVSKAIEQDRQLGGLSKWLEIKSVASDDGDTMPYGAFALVVEIVYVTEGVTP